MDLFLTHTYKETHLLGTGGLNLTPGLVTQTKENPSHSHEIIKRWLKLLYNMYYFKLIFYLRGLSQKSYNIFTLN